jgi:ketosteroid isomerase-like protein
MHPLAAPALTLTLSLSLSLFAAAALAQTPDAAPVVAAERAFAADARALGITASFTRWSRDDAVVIGGGRVQSVRTAYPPSVPRPADEPVLAWWPNWAGMALSGDLGFTTGAVEVGGRRGGHYFTIWARQADGGWRWVYDGGTGASSADAPGPGTEPALLATATAGSASPAAAMDTVRQAEAALAAAAARDSRAAHLAVLADDGRLYVAPLPPATGRAALASALEAWPATFDLAPPMGGGASGAGDLVWTYGAAQWRADAGVGRGHYVQLWQTRPDGWRLVFAQLIPAPPTPVAVPAPPVGDADALSAIHD